MEQSAGQNGEALPPDAKVYSLPERGFGKYATGLALQVALCGVIALAIALVAHYTTPRVSWWRVAQCGGIVVVGLLFYIPLFLRQRKQFWKQVRVEVDDQSIVVRQGAGWLPDLHLLPQRHVRVERDQVTDIREMSYGLVMVTRYDPEALVIPNRLALTDYQEIIGTLSKWRTIERRSVPAKTAARQTGTRLETDLKRAEQPPEFYERSFGAGLVGLVIGVLAGTLPGLFAIVAWAKDREVPTHLAWIILGAYLINLFVVMIGTEIAFAWMDYGLALAGLRMHARSSFWVGIAATVFVFALAITARLNLVECLIVTVIGSIVAGIFYWVLGNIILRSQPSFVSSTIIAPDSASSAAPAGMAAGGPIEGVYRLTFGEYFTANGYFILSQPRSYGRPRFVSALLPRSVGHRAMQATFSAHPLRNELMHFSVDDNSIRWLTDDAPESIVSWDQVKQVVRTREGLLFCRAGDDFNWLPFHAFSAKDGAQALIEVAKRHTAYVEIAKHSSKIGAGA